MGFIPSSKSYGYVREGISGQTGRETYYPIELSGGIDGIDGLSYYGASYIPWVIGTPMGATI